MATQNFHHPLPAPPSEGQQDIYAYQAPRPPVSAQQYQQQQRPTTVQNSQQYPPVPTRPSIQKQNSERRPKSRSRTFSFRSDKSSKTEKSQGSVAHKAPNLHETHEEKESRRLHSKADPTLAMNELEPSAVAQEAAQLAPLRSIQHKDTNGVPISDPDRSNPTRSRWERPLDTIRSFEAAIDGGYNRKSIYKSDTDSVANWNRRSSYYGNNGPRFPHDSYYGGRPNSTFRPDSTMFDPRGSMMMSGGGGGPRDSYYDGGYDTGYNMRNRYSRVQSDPQMNGGRGTADRNVYPLPNNHRSYETVASGSGGSGSLGEPSGYQTDPTSSENSSIKRHSPPKRQEPMNDYGISFGQSPTYQPPNFHMPASQPRIMPDGSQGSGVPPPQVPKKDTGGSLLRKASKVTPAAVVRQRPELTEKRKSWFARRFSKSS